MKSADNRLQGLSVLVTRPRGQAESLSALIESQGGRACQLPLLEIEPVTGVEENEQIKSAILKLDQYDLAIFISSNAASIGLDWIDLYWPQLPAHLSAVAVGPGTAAVLQRMPWTVHCPESGFTSEDMLALPALRCVDGKRIALFRGKGGRELLAGTLRERGARVDYLELYHRRTPDYATGTLPDLLRRERIDVILITSPQMLDVLQQLGESDELVRQLPAIVPSARVQQQARSAGFAHVINAEAATDEAIVSALLQLNAKLAPSREETRNIDSGERSLDV